MTIVRKRTAKTARSRAVKEAAAIDSLASCCESPNGERRALAVDPDIKERNLKRLRRIEGQVRGIQQMVESERYCPEILVQLSAVHEALRGVSRELMRNYLKHCATAAIRSGGSDAETTYNELVDLFHKHAR